MTAKGKLGEKPTISFNTPMTVSDGSYVVLQKGDGDVIEEGDRVCAQGIALNVKDGTELMDTWTKNTPDCSLKVDSKTLSSTYYNQIKGAKINTTIGFGVNAQDSSGYSYILAMTFVSKSKDLEKATGEEVKDVPANLPKVTRAKNGKRGGQVHRLAYGWQAVRFVLGSRFHNRRRSVQRFQRPASGYRGLAEGSGRPDRRLSGSAGDSAGSGLWR